MTTRPNARHAATFVGRGAALLDEHELSWRERVDPAKLNVRDGRYCVLGQVYGSYADGLRALGLTRYVDDASHGFICVERGHPCTCDALADAWRVELTRRSREEVNDK